MDGWQYMIHRSAHQFTWLYRNIHSWHHRLYVPYAFGALYNHPLEGFFLDTLGGGVAHELAGLTTREAIFFFVLSTLKTVDDHCGFAFPWDPFQHLFGNNADYHDIHRMSSAPLSLRRAILTPLPSSDQVAGLKKNYSQPWFISWEYVLSFPLSCFSR
jgi:sphinganine C4-monooxygenase